MRAVVLAGYLEIYDAPRAGLVAFIVLYSHALSEHDALLENPLSGSPTAMALFYVAFLFGLPIGRTLACLELSFAV